MKKYLHCVKIKGGVTMHIAFYPDTPNKNYRLYYCGSDMGYRFEYLGNASRKLQSIVNQQINNGVTGHELFYTLSVNIPTR